MIDITHYNSSLFSRIQISIRQTKLKYMIQDNDNFRFEDKNTNKQKSSTRIIFANANGLNVDTDAHSLRNIRINSQIHNTSILLLVKNNTHWKDKRDYDNFRKAIAQYRKGVAVTTSETNLNWNSIYKSRGTEIIVNNKVRSRKLKSGEDRPGLGR